jgi:putative ABC transport system permease protein
MDFGQIIPLYVRFEAKRRPIVGTTLDYFDFRGLRIDRGRKFATLGECVLGHEAAASLELGPGQTLISTPENAFDLAGVYPLKMHIVGVNQATGTPDDIAVFVDLKTSWIIQGLGHGHQDLAKASTDDALLKREGNRLTANPSVVNYTEINEANIDSFHFHGDSTQLPVTATIVIPRDDKSRTLLMGRYLANDDPVQIVRPSVVMDSLLKTVLRVRDFIVAAALLLTVSTVMSVVLVFVLSLRLRQRELATMAKIGCSRARIASIVACEILLVVMLSVLLAGGLTMMTRRFGERAIRWFLL